MADSNITKRALAMALHELMDEVPFEKITVAHICEKCEMNRKSFYYHFKDKYDLVNWIFDTEFISLAASSSSDDGDDYWEFIEKVCETFYQNRDFYRKAFQIKGQNSFSDHFREYIQPLVRNRLVCLIGDDSVDEFTADFFTDAILCALERWLLAKDCIPSEQFVAKVKYLIQRGAVSIYQEIEPSIHDALSEAT